MANELSGLPAEHGFRMPAEFEPHDGTWMLWPERPDIWPFGGKPAQGAFAEIASTIAQYEPVTMGVSRAQFKNARHRLPPCIRVVEMSYDGCWVRDTGPTFVVDDHGAVRGVDWIFNAWGGLDGGLYFPWDQDDLVASKILEIERVPRYRAEVVLEGGAINTDGEGTLLTTEECLLNPNRNPAKSKHEVERLLKSYLNVSNIIWIPRGLDQDEAGGHIDNICSFVRPGVVVLAWTDKKGDPQYDRCRDAHAVLETSHDSRGRKLDIYKLLLPDPIIIPDEVSRAIDVVTTTVPRRTGDVLPASYINFYIVNGAVILPQFGCATDELALDTLRNLFYDRVVIGVSARELLYGGGNIHCNVQQQPAHSARLTNN